MAEEDVIGLYDGAGTRLKLPHGIRFATPPARFQDGVQLEVC